MVFENEINIYNPNAIVEQFRTQSTQIAANQGRIAAIISDTQIQTLQNGTVNMFDRLVSAEMNITGIFTQVSELRQADGALESEISTVRQTASSISAEVSSVKNNYARKAQIILAINNTTQESETLINAEHISLAGKRINLTSENIEITSTNFKVDKNGKVTATSGSFSGSITASEGTIGGFSIGFNNIHNGMTSRDDTSNNGVWLGTNGIALGKGKFKVTSDGYMTATSGSFGGSLNAATGTFKGSLSAATGTFSGSLSAATGSFNGSITSIDGNQKLYINEALLQGYESNMLFGTLDLCAQYADSGRHVSLRSEGTLHFQASTISFEDLRGNTIGWSGSLPVGSDYYILVSNGIITGWSYQ